MIVYLYRVNILYTYVNPMFILYKYLVSTLKVSDIWEPYSDAARNKGGKDCKCNGGTELWIERTNNRTTKRCTYHSAWSWYKQVVN